MCYTAYVMCASTYDFMWFDTAATAGTCSCARFCYGRSHLKPFCLWSPSLILISRVGLTLVFLFIVVRCCPSSRSARWCPGSLCRTRRTSQAFTGKCASGSARQVSSREENQRSKLCCAMLCCIAPFRRKVFGVYLVLFCHAMPFGRKWAQAGGKRALVWFARQPRVPL